MRSRSSAVSLLILARLYPLLVFITRARSAGKQTDFETRLVLVADLNLGSLEKASRDALHRDEPALQTHSSETEFVDGSN